MIVKGTQLQRHTVRANGPASLQMDTTRLATEDTLRLISLCQTTNDPDVLKACQERLLANNLGLIKKFARQYSILSGVDIDDMISEGTMGVMEAVFRFDESKGAFSTYAAHYIKKWMRAAIKGAGIIRLPQHILNGKSKLAKRHLMEHGRRPTDSELQQLLAESGLSHDATCGVLQRRADMPTNEVPDSDSVDDEVDASELMKSLTDLSAKLSLLRPDAREMIMAKYGLDPYGRTHSLREIGSSIGFTRERVRQLVADGIEQLRKPRPQYPPDEKRWGDWEVRAESMRSILIDGRGV